jgi:hypothetical protein
MKNMMLIQDRHMSDMSTFMYVMFTYVLIYPIYQLNNINTSYERRKMSFILFHEDFF